MDFRLSYNWLRDFVDVRLSPEELADRLSLHSVSVERLHRMGEGLGSKVVVGRVEKIEPHPNADKLKVAYVAHRAAGRASSRAAGQLVRVVCGGTNLREGMFVAFAPPGTMVRWHGQGDPVELKPTEIRGVRSDGMICAASEIGLGEYFAEGEREILDLSFLAAGQQGKAAAGQGGSRAAEPIGEPLARALGLDDTILDCEITTNRSDLMSIVGLAREVTAIVPSASSRAQRSGVEGSRFDRDFSAPFAAARSGRNDAGSARVRVRVEDAAGCSRYGAVVIDGVTVGPSPWWLQHRLLAAGLRPLNNVVDATNYILLERGQPLHAFDAARLQAAGQQGKAAAGQGGSRAAGLEIVVRRARSGESLRALDGNTYKLRPEDLVIAATAPSPSLRGGVPKRVRDSDLLPSGNVGAGGGADRPVAIAGVIGGEETGVTAGTTRIILECANFDPLSVRRTSRALGIRTESSIRFEKGLPPESVDHTIARAVELIIELAGGTAARPVIVGKTPPRLPTIRLEPKRVSARIGAPITPVAMQQALTTLGCRVTKMVPGTLGKKVPGTIFAVTPPWWRRGDFEGAHDLVEEVARVYGYHRLPSVLPIGTLPAAAQRPQPPQTPFDWEDRARSVLIGAGATEVLTYSLTGREAMERCGYTTDQALALENPLSEDLAYLRPSVIPTLLPLIAGNQGHSPSGVVFEVGNVYIPAAGQGGSRAAELPREELRLCIAAYGRLVSGGHVMKLKGIVAHLLERLCIRDATFRISEQCALPPSGVAEGFSPPRGDPRCADRGRLKLAATSRPSSTCLWHPGRTMDVVVNGTLVGVLGEIHPTVVEAFGIDQRVAVAELDWAPILAVCGPSTAPPPPPQLPAVKRDLAFTVDRKTPYADIATVLERFDPLLSAFELFDQYEGGNLPLGKKSLAFHLTFEHPDRTLTAEQVDVFLSRLTTVLQQRFGAEVRS